jgi:hypothetical protein
MEGGAMAVLAPVEIDELPRSVEAFIALRDRVAQVPQGGAAMMVVALLVYVEDEDLGRQCLAITVDREKLSEGPKGYEGQQLRASDIWLLHSQIRDKPYIARSYVKGAMPDNGYQLPESSYIFEFSDNPHSGDPERGTYKVFVKSSGASSPRPVTVKRNDEGIWKAYEWSTLIVGVQEPDEEVVDDL